MNLRSIASFGISILAMIFLPATSVAQLEPAPGKNKEGASVRIVCVQRLSGDKDEEIAFAKKTEDGKWIEFGELTLSTTMITDWVQVPFGSIHLLSKGSGEAISLASFTIASDMKGVILILIPDQAKQTYRLQVIDPDKLQFQKGKALIVNYSNMPAMIHIGKGTKTVAPGQYLIQTIETDENDMYPMLIAIRDKDKKIVPCYDRRASSNPNTRTLILLFPDPNTGLRTVTLSEFGPFM